MRIARTIQSLLAAALLTTLGSSCLRVDPPSGTLGCGAAGECPDGYACLVNGMPATPGADTSGGKCWHTGFGPCQTTSAPDGGTPEPVDMAAKECPLSPGSSQP